MSETTCRPAWYGRRCAAPAAWRQREVNTTSGSRPVEGERPAQRRLKALVRGRVQGVYFRQFVWSQAGRLGVTGWVRNGEDGRSVEVEAEGPSDALKRLLKLLQEGPPGSRVDDVQVSWSDDPQGYTTFEVRF